MKIFLIDETAYVVANSAEAALQSMHLEKKDINSIVEVPESDWDQPVEILIMEENNDDRARMTETSSIRDIFFYQ